MQTREIESHEILAEIEMLENALDEVNIAENSGEISGLWRTKTLFEKRLKLEDGNVFLMPDDDKNPDRWPHSRRNEIGLVDESDDSD